jgi:hypothetical protein
LHYTNYYKLYIIVIFWRQLLKAMNIILSLSSPSLLVHVFQSLIISLFRFLSQLLFLPPRPLCLSRQHRLPSSLGQIVGKRVGCRCRCCSHCFGHATIWKARNGFLGHNIIRLKRQVKFKGSRSKRWKCAPRTAGDH